MPFASANPALLAELLLRKQHGRPSCKGTLFKWFSSGPSAGQWVQNEVALPLPSKPKEHTSRPSCTFCADTISVFRRIGLCWADLLQGILICNNMWSDCPQFCFVELPKMRPFKSCIDGRGVPAAHSSVCCVEDTLRFITIDDHGQSDPSRVTITIWQLQDIQTSDWAMSWAFSFGDIPLDPLYTTMMPTFPVLSMTNEWAVYVTAAADHGFVPEKMEVCVRHVLCISTDMRAVEVSNLPPGSGSTRPNFLATIFSSSLSKSTSNEDQEREEKISMTEIDAVRLKQRCFRSFEPLHGQSATGSKNLGGLASLADD